MHTKYYASSDRKTFRVAREIAPECFVVVKIFADSRSRSVKFWIGDFEKTVKSWRTYPYDPTPQAKHLLDVEFECTLAEFAPLFNIVGQL